MGLHALDMINRIRNNSILLKNINKSKRFKVKKINSNFIPQNDEVVNNHLNIKTNVTGNKVKLNYLVTVLFFVFIISFIFVLTLIV